MRYRDSLLPLVVAAVSACHDGSTPPDPYPVPPAPTVLLRDVVIPNLPSPYYHFEYDTDGRIVVASFASGLRQYEVRYDGGRISEMKNTAVLNGDRLTYVYDDAGRVASVRYADSNGLVYTVVFMSYDGQKLTGIERDRRVEGGFIVDKTTSLSYDSDGNVREITEHHPATDDQQETTTVDRFENYDTKTNVDGFSLIHDEFFDHLVLLPGVQLQKGNPARQTHTGDGINFTVEYDYSYDDKGRPLTKNGALTVLNGSDAGKQFQTTSIFSYF